MTGYPGVAVVLIYVDTTLARSGTGVEAIAHYVSHVFSQGARLVHMEVLELNAPVLRIMQRAGFQPQARMREQVYAAGRFWDVITFAFDAQALEGLRRRYPGLWPGDSRRPAALGGRRERE
jgi:RimJ/RimL family protein N-acetyltransferase